MPASTPIATTKTAALQRAQDAVTKGYDRYVSGTIKASKIAHLAQKFHSLYGIGCTPAQRAARKAKGVANGTLVVYWPGIRLVPLLSAGEGSDSNLVAERRTACTSSDLDDVSDLGAAQKKAFWLLLATQGTGFETEQPRDASSRPWLTFLGYELVRRTSLGKAAPAWTWRRPKSEMTEHYTMLVQLLNQGRYEAVHELLQRLAHQPGFGGVRGQSKELARFAQQRGYPGEVPPFFYLSRVSHGTRLALSDVPGRDPE